MPIIEGLTINEANYNLEGNGNGRLAVLIYNGEGEPSRILDEAVRIYTNGQGYHELIDANLDNPWTRVIISHINEMNQDPFNTDLHRMTRPI